MMGQRLFRALAIAFIAAVAGVLLKAIGLLMPLAIAVAVGIATVAYFLPALGVKGLDAAIDTMRAWAWRDQQGRHHSFAGVLLDIDDDGRHVWVGAEGLRRLLGNQDSDQRLQVRYAGRAKLDAEGALMLRVDAVAAALRNDTTRRDPARLRLLHYLEHDVLYPAAERRRRSETID